MPGYSLTDQPDAPRLPVASALIALPPDGSAAVQVLQSDDTQFALSGPLALAPSPQGVERDASGAPVGGAFVRAATAVPFPSASIKLDDLGLVRGVHLARVTFYPVHPSGSGVRVTTHLRASIAFKAPALSSLTAKEADPIVASVQAEVLNPEQVQRAATSPATLNVHSRSVTPTAAIEANTPGMTVVTYEALDAVGFPAAGIDPHNLHLTRSGSNVAYQLQDNGNTLFEPGESLLFYASPRFSRWTNNDVYMLSLQAAPGMHMTSAAPAPQPAGHVWLDQTAETNALYTPQCYCGPIPPGRDGDRWTWDDLRLPDRAAVTYPITLTTLDVTQPATLTVWFIGYTDVATAPDHRIDVALNSITYHARNPGERRQQRSSHSARNRRSRRRRVAGCVRHLLCARPSGLRQCRHLHRRSNAPLLLTRPRQYHQPARLRRDQPRPACADHQSDHQRQHRFPERFGQWRAASLHADDHKRIAHPGRASNGIVYRQRNWRRLRHRHPSQLHFCAHPSDRSAASAGPHRHGGKHAGHL
ncbi:MAG: hypothetical protein HW378_3857 [Anaerolineales bacterium]|nr:hypothetical protein [Anaerolineales bacterium]